MCKLENVRYVRDNVVNWQLGFFNTASLAFSGASGYSEVKSSPGATTKVVWEWLFKGYVVKNNAVSEKNMQNKEKLLKLWVLAGILHQFTWVNMQYFCLGFHCNHLAEFQPSRGITFLPIPPKQLKILFKNNRQIIGTIIGLLTL